MTIQGIFSDGLSLSISQSCHALEVIRSGYYKWRVQPERVPSANMDPRGKVGIISRKTRRAFSSHCPGLDPGQASLPGPLPREERALDRCRSETSETHII